MRLAKQHLDVGLYTEDLDAHRRFWEEVLGLPYEGFQKLGGGVRQHRYGLNGSVLKVNHSRGPLGDGPTGLRRLVVASDRVDRPVDLEDPDGTPVRLVPVGHDGITHVGVEVAAIDPGATRRWWTDGLGAEEAGDAGVRIGTTVLLVAPAQGRAPTSAVEARGLRYLTAQVADVPAEYEALVGSGSDGPVRPIRLGDTAVIAFVRSPDGDWLELSQRADLTGPLPDL